VFDRKTLIWAVLAIFAGIAFFLAMEIREEPHMSATDLAFELLDIVPSVLTSVGVVLLFRVTRQQREEHQALVKSLSNGSTRGETWRADARPLLNGLGEAIEREFDRWGLTEAEREVALLLLKGLSLKEVAGVRDTSERTVRVQARSLYSKAGLAGRAELSAYFLEDLLAPIEGVR
jgi:DNA-binding CsgD family transcriptional regulator